MIKELWKQVVEIQLRTKKEKLSINSTVLWRASNRMGSPVLSFSYFTQYPQFQKQCGNLSLLLNLSFKGWKSWKSWSRVTVLFSPYLFKKREFTSPRFWWTALKLSISRKCCCCFFFLKLGLQIISNVNDWWRNIPESPALRGTVSARVYCWYSPPSVKRGTITALKETKMRQ